MAFNWSKFWERSAKFANIYFSISIIYSIIGILMLIFYRSIHNTLVDWLLIYVIVTLLLFIIILILHYCQLSCAQRGCFVDGTKSAILLIIHNYCLLELITYNSIGFKYLIVDDRANTPIFVYACFMIGTGLLFILLWIILPLYVFCYEPYNSLEDYMVPSDTNA